MVRRIHEGVIRMTKKQYVPFSRNYRGAKYDRAIVTPKNKRDAKAMVKRARGLGHKAHIKEYNGVNYVFIKKRRK